MTIHIKITQRVPPMVVKSDFVKTAYKVKATVTPRVRAAAITTRSGSVREQINETI